MSSSDSKGPEIAIVRNNISSEESTVSSNGAKTTKKKTAGRRKPMTIISPPTEIWNKRKDADKFIRNSFVIVKEGQYRGVISKTRHFNGSHFMLAIPKTFAGPELIYVNKNQVIQFDTFEEMVTSLNHKLRKKNKHRHTNMMMKSTEEFGQLDTFKEMVTVTSRPHKKNHKGIKEIGAESVDGFQNLETYLTNRKKKRTTMWPNFPFPPSPSDSNASFVPFHWIVERKNGDGLITKLMVYDNRVAYKSDLYTVIPRDDDADMEMK